MIMIKIGKFFLLIMAVLFFATSCGTLFTKGGGDYREGEQAYKSGNYAVAVEKALAATSVNDEFPEAEDLLNRAATEGPKTLLATVEELKSSGNPFVWGDIVGLYVELNKIYDYLAGASKAEQFGVQRYNDELEEAIQAAADSHYIAGVEELNKGDFKSARKAVGHFNAVHRFIPNYKDTGDLLDQALAAATAVVAIHQNGAEPLLLEKLKEQLGSKGVNNRFTKYLFNSDLGTENGASYSQVLSAA